MRCVCFAFKQISLIIPIRELGAGFHCDEADLMAESTYGLSRLDVVAATRDDVAPAVGLTSSKHGFLMQACMFYLDTARESAKCPRIPKHERSEEVRRRRVKQAGAPEGRSV